MHLSDLGFRGEIVAIDFAAATKISDLNACVEILAFLRDTKGNWSRCDLSRLPGQKVGVGREMGLQCPDPFDTTQSLSTPQPRMEAESQEEIRIMIER